MFIILTRVLPDTKLRCAVNPDAMQWYQEADAVLVMAEGYTRTQAQQVRSTILCDNGPEIFVEEEFNHISAAIESLEKK